MAQKQIVQLVDDLDGVVLAPNKGETVTFTLDGAAYEIDLATKNAARLRKVFAEYVSAGRRVRKSAAGTVSVRSSRVPTQADPTAVREWASANGIEVSNRGRIPKAVIEQFHSAGN